MSTFNSVTGLGARPPTADAATVPPTEPETDTETPLQGAPGSVHIIEKVPPEPPWAVPMLGGPGSTVPVSGGGPAGPVPRPEPQPAPVTGPPDGQRPIAPGPIKTQFGDLVDALLNKSPTLQKIWAEAQAKGFEFKETTTQRSQVTWKPPAILINRNDIHPEKGEHPAVTAGRLASLISHELGHTTLPAPMDLQAGSRQEFIQRHVDQALYHEGAAAFVNTRARFEILANGTEITVRGGLDLAYISIYQAHLSGQLSEEQAIQQMALVQADEPEVIDSKGNVLKTRGQVYTEGYAKEWDDRHKE